MKICMVVGGVMEDGGIQTQSIELSKALVARGHQVRILCTGINMPLPPEVIVEAVPKPFTTGVYRRIKELRKAGGLDIVHAQGCAGFNVILNRILGGVPYVLTLHSTAVSEYKVSARTFFSKQYFTKFYFEEMVPAHFASALICVSNYTAGEASKYYLLRMSRLQVIPNGIDMSRFRDDTPYAKDGKTVLMVGRIDPRKGYMEFMENVAPLLVKRMPDIKVNVVGSEFVTYKDYTARLKEIVVEKGLSNNVKFLGTQPFEELRRHYNSSDVFVLASREEGFGIVLLEAQSCGLPAVAFSNSGMREAVADGKSGYLVNSYEEMADKVIALLSDNTKRAELGAGAKVFSAGFSWGGIAERVEKVYERVLGKK